MYMRFVTDRWDGPARTESGLFGALSRALATVDRESWQFLALLELRGWFDRHLDVPGQLGLRTRRAGYRAGVCWFRPEAREHINQARYMAWLLTDLGHPVREIRARRPGQILWRDPHQVVAVAEPGAPRAFG